MRSTALLFSFALSTMVQGQSLTGAAGSPGAGDGGLGTGLIGGVVNILMRPDVFMNDEAVEHCRAAIDLHPESWNMFRQSAAKDPRGLASGPEFWARVDALGQKPYYAPLQIDGN